MTAVTLRQAASVSLILLFLGTAVASAAQTPETAPQPPARIHGLFPPGIHVTFNGTQGAHDWYRSQIGVSITLDNGTIVHWIYYSIDNGSWLPYYAPFSIEKEGMTLLSIDIADVNYTEWWENYTFHIDKTPPTIQLSKRKLSSHRITFTADAQDTMSGMWRVEFTLDGNLQKNLTSPPYTWTWEGTGNHVVTATAYDMAGNSAAASQKTPYIPNERFLLLHDLLARLVAFLRSHLG